MSFNICLNSRIRRFLKFFFSAILSLYNCPITGREAKKKSKTRCRFAKITRKAVQRKTLKRKIYVRGQDDTMRKLSHCLLVA